MQNNLPTEKSARRNRRFGWLLAGAAGILLAGGCAREPVSRGTRVNPAGKPSSSKTEEVQYHALVIGISQYDHHHGAGWETLQTARNDASAVAETLRDRYGFKVTALLDQDATRSAVLSAMDNLSTLTPHDAVVVYFAGHGYYDEDMDEGYWIPVDARRRDGDRLPKEDWVWNSMITKIVGASQARHVLVVADSCYGGSMFRGPGIEPKTKDLTWYQRAIEKPSRYLITSGDIEPVLDSGGRHSIFAQELLNYLNYSDARIFAASDLAFSLREKVSALTGQMVRMGPLAVAGHAGGEFIFISRGAHLPASATLAKAELPGARRDASVPSAAPAVSTERRMAGDAVTLQSVGATNAARILLDNLLQAGSDDRMVLAMTAYLNGAQQQRDREDLQRLIDRIEKSGAAKQTATDQNESAFPRILACMGPSGAEGDADLQSAALLIRIALRSELEQSGLVQVVEREALQDVLQELDLGMSNLSDSRAQLSIGKLLPASTLLMGTMVSAQGARHLYLRLVDTETTRIIASFSATLKPGEDFYTTCADLAAKIARKTAEYRPLTARAELTPAGELLAHVGSFQGARPDNRFDVFDRPAVSVGAVGAPKDRAMGSAVVLTVDDASSRLEPDATIDPSQIKGALWVREVLP